MPVLQKSESRPIRGSDWANPGGLFKAGRVTCTVSATACVIEPTVAVTVTVYVAGVVKRLVETVSVDEAVPFAGSVTLVGLSDAVGHTRTMSEEEIDTLRFPVPESPLTLVRVIVDVPDEPMTILNETGLAPIVKSPGGGGAVTTMACELLAVNPPVSIAWTTTV